MKNKLLGCSLTMIFAFHIPAFGQVIGRFPSMDGGFENQATGNVVVVSSIATGAQRSDWTRQSTSLAGSISGSGGRSGPKYATISATAAARFQSPTADDRALSNTTSYVQQYYYRTSGATGADNGQAGHSPDGTLQPGTYASVSLPGTSGVWTKRTTVQTSGTSTNTPRYGVAVIRFSAASNGSIDVDDFVVYEGTSADTTAPNAPTGFASNNVSMTTLDIAWTAPSGGVDQGGYVILRDTTEPVTAPNANGIYAVGNSIAGAQVVYIGTNTTFSDSGLNPDTLYHYKIYAVDKAFNYSGALYGAVKTTPEPAALGLVALGALAFLRRR